MAALQIGKIIGKLFTSKAMDVIDKVVKDKDLKQQLESNFKTLEKNVEAEANRLAVEDRKSARELFKTDSKLQKIFAIVFLVGYIAVTFLVLYGAYEMTVNDVVFNNETVAIITMLFTAMSNKINTIVDFLFGGSAQKN